MKYGGVAGKKRLVLNILLKLLHFVLNTVERTVMSCPYSIYKFELRFIAVMLAA